MKLSFIIPAYNEEKLIAECLQAILNEVNAYDFDTEIIVVDNASTDRTGEIAQSFSGVKVVRETRKGIVWARRAGFEAATGDLIANVDADTRLPPGWLKKVFDEFSNDPKLLALSGPYIYHDLHLVGRAMTKLFYIFGYIGNSLSRVLLNKAAMLQGGNYVARKDALIKIGGYNTDIEFYGEDTDIGNRLSQIGKVKWTFKLPMYSSGRRIAGEGVITMGFKYGINFIWTTFLGKPFTKEYIDIRPE